MDPLSQLKYDALSYYSDEELKRLDNNAIEILIDCQHKGWSGKLQSALVSPVTVDGDPWIDLDGDTAPDAFTVTLTTKDGREHTAFHDVRGCESLLCQVQEQYKATIACLDALLPQPA